MSNEIRIFNFNGADLGLVEIDGEPWFVAKDVCKFLRLTNTTKAVSYLEPHEKGLTNCYTPGGNQKITIISEPGLYLLIGRSRKPEAKKFSHWVRHEVLPSIRKCGSYSASHEEVTHSLAGHVVQHRKELDEHKKRLDDHEERLRKYEKRYELPKSPLEHHEDKTIPN